MTRKNLLSSLIIVLVTLAFILAFLNLHHARDYSYTAYTHAVHMESIACDLSDSITCKESGKIPTRSQTNLYQGYILWDSCYEYNDNLACKELTN